MSAERLVSSNRIDNFTFDDVIALADANHVDPRWSEFMRTEFCKSLNLTTASSISELPIEPQWYAKAKAKEQMSSSDMDKYDARPVFLEGNMYFNYVVGIPTDKEGKGKGKGLVVRVGSISKAQITEYFKQPSLPTRTIENFAKVKHMQLSKMATLLFSGFLVLHLDTITILPISGEWVNVSKKLAALSNLQDKAAYLNVFNILATAKAIKHALKASASRYRFDFACTNEYISKPFEQISPQCKKDLPYMIPAINGSPLPSPPIGISVDTVISVGSKDTIANMLKYMGIYSHFTDMLGRKLDRKAIAAQYKKIRAPQLTFDQLKVDNYGLYEAIMIDYARSLKKPLTNHGKKRAAPAIAHARG
jgi:hypothetical protein